MKKRAFIVSALSLSLIGTPLTSNFVEASELPKVPNYVVGADDQNQQFVIEGVSYTVKEGKDYRTVIAKNSEGTQTYVTNKKTGRVSVESDYLTKNEEKEIEKQVNLVKVEMETNKSNSIEVEQGIAGTLTDTSETKIQSDASEIGIQSIVGSWVWSSWDYYKVTVSGKFTLQTITAALLSYIPYVGPVAGALAAVHLQYNLKTGYYKRRGGTAADSDPNYLWSKYQFNLYSDSARTNLKASKTTSPEKVRVY